MGTTEDKLKAYILDRYKSIREFTISIDMPYTTFDSVLKRGIDNSSITNIIKICKALNISADELANGNIVSTISKPNYKNDVVEMLNLVKSDVIKLDNLTLRGEPINENVKDIIVNNINNTINTLEKI
ncbi:hypothetical protein [Peptacetobacter sp.]|uniref:hypothetical protein n=1 Tax=Peptacetobacter sp. TaxID=2991975 RepID=UPI003AB23D1A